MAKIRVKLGGCGIKYTDANGNERHALKTPESGAFECDDAQAARLVSLGVAEYVGCQGRAVDPATEHIGEPAEPDQEPEKIVGHLDAAELETWTIEQLKKLAADMGVDLTGCKKKADYIAAITAEEVEIDAEDDADELPELSAADPE